MNFNFKHTENDISQSLGISPEELIELQVKFEYLKKKIILKISSELVNKNQKQGTYSLSQMVEELNNDLTREELAVVLAIQLKDDIVSFYQNNIEMIRVLLSEELLNNLNKN